MPVKKTTSKKTKAAKPKKSSATKKRKISAVKPASKKTTAKKAPVKKKTKPAAKKAALARKESIKPREIKHAHAFDVHQKQQGYQRSIPAAKPGEAFEIVKKFSFPTALSQVRSRVEREQPSATMPAEPSHRIVAQQMPERKLSPYVLDLKRGLTIIQAHPSSQTAKKQPPKLQEPFDLFREQPTTFAQRMRARLSSLMAPLRRQKQINFVPLDHKYLPGSALKRQVRMLKWRGTGLIRPLFAPLHKLQENRRQKTLRLPSSYGQRSIQPIMKTTRSGQPIAVRHLSATLASLRKKREQSIINSVTELSSVIAKPARAPLFSQLSFAKAAVPFAALAMVVALPFGLSSISEALTQAQGEVFGATNSAVRTLQQAGANARSMNFLAASSKFSEAGQAFSAAGALVQNQYGKTAKVLSVMPVIGKKLDAAQDLLDAGSLLSSAANLLSQGVASFTDGQHFLSEQAATYKLEYLFVRLQEAKPAIKQAAGLLAGIDPSILPDEMRPDVERLQQALPEVNRQFDQFESLAAPLLAFLGHDRMERHLILFQNNTELRATGGFMGSLALVDIDRGEIKNIEIPGGGPYDFQGSLFENIKAPRALQLINPRLELQDANWFFDWPTSARKVMSLYEKAGGPSVDSVIAINTNVLAALLEFVGPVYLADYEKEITAENFREILQTHVEFEYDKQLNQPKKIIADLTPVLLERVKELETEKYLELAGVLSKLLAQRDVLIYHMDEEVQAAFSQYGWAGEVVDADTDYLAVVHTNLAGGKTDGVINDRFNLSVHVSANGMLKHTLTIEREHTGVKGTPLVGVRNVDYLRVYVPYGSQLISAEGFETPPAELFELPGIDWKEDPDLAASEQAYQPHPSGAEIYTESGKTVFAHWLQVDPGTTGRAVLVYETPKLISDIEIPQKEASWTDWVIGTERETRRIRPYQLYWQKQPGAWDPELNITLNFPQQWQLQASSEYMAQQGTGTWKTSAVMKGDALFSFLFY